MVRAGETYTRKEVTLRIIEVYTYRTATGRREQMIAYRIEHGSYISPVAHFWIGEGEDIRAKINSVIDHYLSIRSLVTRR